MLSSTASQSVRAVVVVLCAAEGAGEGQSAQGRFALKLVLCTDVLIGNAEMLATPTGLSLVYLGYPVENPEPAKHGSRQQPASATDSPHFATAQWLRHDDGPRVSGRRS